MNKRFCALFVCLIAVLPVALCNVSVKQNRTGSRVQLAVFSDATRFCLSIANSLQVNYATDGSYSVLIGGISTPVLQSGPTEIYAGGKWYSTVTGTLQLVSTTLSAGVDVWGAYTRAIMTWTAGSVPFVTAVRPLELKLVVV